MKLNPGLFAALESLPCTLRLYSWQMSGRLAWILQELPALIGVAFTVITATTAQRSIMSVDSVNAALMGLFVLHYVHRHVDELALVLIMLYKCTHYNSACCVRRTFIFPLRLRNPKPTPVIVFLMAAAFCTYNGYARA